MSRGVFVVPKKKGITMKVNNYRRIAAIDTDTGEVLGSVVLKNDGTEELVLGTENTKQKEAIRLKNKKVTEVTEFIQNNEGSYYHLIYKYGYPLFDRLQSHYGGNKANIHIIRFMQLATYITFGGKLYDSNNNEIKKSSLGKIWHTENNRKSVNETYKILMECGYIYETKEGYIMINEDIIVKGAIEDFKKLHKADDSLTYVRIYSNNVRDMYEGTEPKQRKQLANLFKALPFINFKHNVFCMNPTETDETKLQLLSWKDLATLCGYNETNKVNRFKKDLWNLSIYGYDAIGEFKTKSGMAICINPKIYYGGNDIEDVKRLYVMFSMVQNKK